MPRTSILEAVQHIKQRKRLSDEIRKTPSSGERRRASLLIGSMLETAEDVRTCNCNPRRCFLSLCKSLASSSKFSAVTTMLTIYALFGDDLRLLLTEKSSDPSFDYVTIASIILFGMEVLAFSFGKASYAFGFFFWLDLLSTITLVLDVSTVAEYCFGDSISVAASSDSGEVSDEGGGGGGGDSADAARAARMSRAGTKAGRIVRLVRLVRLIRLVKLYKKGEASLANPGYDWGDEDEDGGSESAVSKKLSEMTTRRVIMLVLAIMLILPIFRTDMYGDELSTSGQLGADYLFRRWCSDVKEYQPLSNETAYLASPGRRLYEDDFLMYIYYHNWFCDSGNAPDTAESTPADAFSKLFWLGAIPPSSKLSQYMFPTSQGGASYNWDDRWEGRDWAYYNCKLPAAAQNALTRPWSEMTACLGNFVKGTSLISSADPTVTCPDGIRFNERSAIYPTLREDAECGGVVFMFVFDRRAGSKMEAALNAAQTLFICFLLGFGAMTFSADANKLVLRPIERMITKLEKIRANPLEAMTLGEKDVNDAMMRYRQNRAPTLGTLATESPSWHRTWWDKLTGKNKPEDSEPMETVVLEKTIIKIGALLALTFGEVGAEMIARNMSGADSAFFNAMVPGHKVHAVFAYCKIRNFSDATELLGENVLVFVNRVSAIVHAVVNEFLGNPTRNTGEGYIFVWRHGHEADERWMCRMADLSLLCVARIIGNMAKSPLIQEYRHTRRFDKRLPGYRVRMGFILHCGWAVEGVLGSEFKIDASYVGQTVDMMASLYQLTRELGCQVLLTKDHIDLMTPRLAEECRRVDCVKVSTPAGTTQSSPVGIYALDLDDLAVDVDLSLGIAVTKATKHRLKAERFRLKSQRQDLDYPVHDLLSFDSDISAMRNKYTAEFLGRFGMAYQNYEYGEWQSAKVMLEAVCRMLGGDDGHPDGPTVALLRRMEAQDYQAPIDWQGHREISTPEAYPQFPHNPRAREIVPDENEYEHLYRDRHVMAVHQPKKASILEVGKSNSHDKNSVEHRSETRRALRIPPNKSAKVAWA